MHRVSKPSPRFPWGATLIVALAVAAMIGLGIWQLRRLHWKEGLIARYQVATTLLAPVPWPGRPDEIADALYRRASVSCLAVRNPAAVAGRNAQGQAGWAHLVTCVLPDGVLAQVVLGWSNDPAPRSWSGGDVSGIIAPGASGAARLIASPPLGGLAASARPDPRDLPNNHLAYAVQWFLFATTALTIYAIALWKRMKS